MDCIKTFKHKHLISKEGFKKGSFCHRLCSYSDNSFSQGKELPGNFLVSKQMNWIQERVVFSMAVDKVRAYVKVIRET